MTDLALAATVTAYTSLPGVLAAPSNPGRVKDGDDATLSEIDTPNIFGNYGYQYTGWHFDFGAAKDIAYVTLKDYYYSSNPTDTWYIETSSDDSTWTQRAFSASSPLTGWHRATLTGGPISARYLRFTRQFYFPGTGPYTYNFYDHFGTYTLQIEGDSPFVAEFSGDPLHGSAPLTVDFTDLTIGDPTAWDWDFGDGGTSTAQNPSHTYTSSGIYTVTLVASKTGASDSATHLAYVVAYPAGVYIDWDGDGFEVGDYDNVSAHVMSWVITRGSGSELTGGAQPGSCTLVLRNPDDLYNPYNTDSPLYGLLRDGVGVWVGPNSDGALTGDDPRGLFGGRITDITPIPAGGAADSPTVEIICEDFLGWAARIPISLDYTEGLAQDALRLTLLDAISETRYNLDSEIQTINVPQITGDLGEILEGINAATGTRHFVKPEDNFIDWYAYTTRNRFWRTFGVSDSSIDATSDHLTGTSGWRLSADTVTNKQKVTFTPIEFTTSIFTVWQTQRQRIEVTHSHPFRKTVHFDDIVRDAVLDVASTGDPLTASMTAVSDKATISLTVDAGDTAVVTHLSIEGRLARRFPAESYEANDSTSQGSPRGIRAGMEIANEFVGSFPSAVGLADHIIWRFANPQLRPSLTVKNWLPQQFNRDLYSIIDVTSPELKMDARLFEIVGLTHTGSFAASADEHLHITDYVLQESRVQEDPNWFVLNTSTLAPAGTDVLAY